MITYESKLKETQKLKAESTLVITVNISGVPEPAVSWSFEDAELTVTNGTTIETTDAMSTLTIKGVSAKNSGVYKVVAENAAGKDEAEFTFSVRGKPTIWPLYRKS